MKALKTLEIKVVNKALCSSIPVVQEDSGRSIDFVIADMVIPADATARFYAVKPDGTEVYNNCKVNKNTVTVDLTSQVLAKAGIVRGQISIVSGNDIVTTFKFMLEVEESLKSNSAVQSSNQFGALEEALKSVDNIDSNFKNINNKIENLFSGGANILRNTNTETAVAASGAWSNGMWRPNNTTSEGVRRRIAITDAPNPDITWGIEVQRTNGTSALTASQYNTPLIAGYQYTLSCYARMVGGNVRPLLQYGTDSNSTVSNLDLALGDKWEKKSFTFIATSNNANVHFGITSSTIYHTGAIQFCGMKLEVGNKATGWSPSPWDTANFLLKPVQLWTGSSNVAGTKLELSSSINNFKAIIVQYGTPASGHAQLGYGSVTVRRWLEGTWLTSDGTEREIAFPTPLGYIQLRITSDKEIKIQHADNLVRSIHGVYV